MLKRERRFRRSDGVLAQQAADSLILLTLEEWQYYTLNEVGSRVWELFEGPRSVAEVIDTIAQEHDAPVKTIEVDVMELLGDLVNERMLVEAAGVVHASKATA